MNQETNFKVFTNKGFNNKGFLLELNEIPPIAKAVAPEIARRKLRFAKKTH